MNHTPVPNNFVYPEIKESDFVFGAQQIAGTILRPDGDWRRYTPPSEVQKKNGVESAACYIEAQQHTIATILDEQFDVVGANYSSRFNALFSNGTSGGGDALKGAQSFRDYGLVPDELLPFSDDIHSWAEFHSFKGGDQDTCMKAGKKWREEWSPKYDIVFTKNESVQEKYRKAKAALRYSPLPTSVSAWYEQDGTYIKPAGMQDNHLVEVTYIDENNCAYIWDTYPPFEKKLAPYYNFDFSMRWTVDVEAREEKLSIMKQIANAIQTLINLLTPQSIPMPPTPQPEPILTVPEAPKYLWDTKESARHSIRVICDEEGLNVTDKNVICACIQQESNFNPKAVGKPNSNGTIDYGLCQFNNGHNKSGVPFWIGPGATFSSIEEVLNNPEKNVRVMIDEFKHGRLSLWSSYSTGAYKKFL